MRLNRLLPLLVLACAALGLTGCQPPADENAAATNGNAAASGSGTSSAAAAGGTVSGEPPAIK